MSILSLVKFELFPPHRFQFKVLTLGSPIQLPALRKPPLLVLTATNGIPSCPPESKFGLNPFFMLRALAVQCYVLCRGVYSCSVSTQECQHYNHLAVRSQWTPGSPSCTPASQASLYTHYDMSSKDSSLITILDCRDILHFHAFEEYDLLRSHSENSNESHPPLKMYFSKTWLLWKKLILYFCFSFFLFYF